jgi:adenine-specific DNA-methyltransferase
VSVSVTESNYLSSQIIAYIGNKRRLLALIGGALDRFYGPSSEGALFYDLFAGSGVVSRLARARGFRVTANDWEPYARVLSSAWLTLSPGDLGPLFETEGGLEKLLDHFNNLPPLPPESEYVARWYSAADDDPDRADWNENRLFYTRENGRRIDRIRCEIEKLYPPGNPLPDSRKKRDLLIGLLLYEAATHVNTSGVFKAFHKGFGGHGKDALRRILAPISLKVPVLAEAPWPAEVTCEDAGLLARRLSGVTADLAYLDPPYNQHQYGSNYHLLNTIALWDRPPAPLDRNEKGELARKGGIREDWTRTRSPYCIKGKAEAALADLLSNLNARHILLSYSSDGIIPFDTLRELCRRKGRLTLHTGEYVTYRGGRQSDTRRTANIEFLLVIEPGRSISPADNEGIDRVLALRRLGLLFRRRFLCDRPGKPGCEARLTLPGGRLIILVPSAPLQYRMPDNLEQLTLAELSALADLLEPCLAGSADAELEALWGWRRSLPGAPETGLVTLSLALLRRLAHPRYEIRYREWFRRLKNDPLFAGCTESGRLDKLNAQAGKRLFKTGLDDLAGQEYNEGP